MNVSSSFKGFVILNVIDWGKFNFENAIFYNVLKIFRLIAVATLIVSIQVLKLIIVFCYEVIELFFIFFLYLSFRRHWGTLLSIHHLLLQIYVVESFYLTLVTLRPFSYLWHCNELNIVHFLILYNSLRISIIVTNRIEI